jgi:hypothetical protein
MVQARRKATSQKKSIRKTHATPRPFAEWRTDPVDRAEDAAHAFGHRLIEHCREEALKKVPAAAGKVTRARVEEAVDTALHNVLDLIEGFSRIDIGPRHHLELALRVCVRDSNGKRVERHEISGLDLPIAYWKWAREREFR